MGACMQDDVWMCGYLYCARYTSAGMGGQVNVQVALWMSHCTWVMVQMHGLWCRHGQVVSTAARAAARGEARSSRKWDMGGSSSSNNGEKQQ